ncbi:putative bifunctional diguanylate cyclase/phosphodiesterase [Rhodopirellula halodulae]|uniref:putative bifunctional diguanylate cyclase/phosphodiesterase n=1 Tax=Rhodopirellula halodulae TaxID=2894198 RepID=UPI001E420F1F|nr:EAL domain-containing protein [Rhodopirellula sp. JC737]MCC9658887.1 EAL domain-containing protein [Rhodopirellula sp. JC737]
MSSFDSSSLHTLHQLQSAEALSWPHVGTSETSVPPVTESPRSTGSIDRRVANPDTSTILVAESDETTRETLAKMLRYRNYKVLTAATGRDAIVAVQQQHLDLVLMDMDLPDLDGFRTTRLLRQWMDLSALPIIMVTSAASPNDVIQAFDSGASDHVTKPIDAAVTLARIATQLQLKSALHRLRQSEERYALTARGTNDGMWDWNLITGELYLSPRWRSMVGLDGTDWQPNGATWMDLIHAEDRRRVESDLEAHLCGDTDHFETELRMQDGHQTYRWMLCRGLAVRDGRGTAYRIAGSLTDITEGKVADALTGLPNRMLFNDRVQRCVDYQARNPHNRFAVIFMDVDDFKLINDHFGHDAGDDFLVSIASRLDTSLRKSDAIIARMGGDEFAVLLENIRHVDEAVAVAMRLHDKMRAPFPVGDREILTRASMGIVVSEWNSDSDQPQPTSEDLLVRADTAMYYAKNQSELPYAIFNEEMLAENRLRLELGSELRHSLERDELSLMYQPMVNLANGQTAGFEALLRWEHPEHGPVSPSTFIPIAESNGLIVEIGLWVLRKACQQAIQWKEDFGRPFMISVNVSVRQLSATGFVEAVTEVLDETGLPPEFLKLEVTESLLMQDPEHTIDLLHQLRDIGLTIGIDDFGTGYSSLSYLHRMPMDILKVDRSFVESMFDSDKNAALIRSILALASSLELNVVAEGVETEPQLQRLRELGCHFVQGFHFSEPLHPDDAQATIHREWIAE